MAELSVNVEGLEQVKEYFQKTEKCLSEIDELTNRFQYIFSEIMEQMKKIQDVTSERNQFIKLTGEGNNNPVYVRSFSISGLKLIDDAKSYTEVLIGDGDIYRVTETPETILRSLGYAKHE